MDDEKAISDMEERMLRRLGYDVSCRTSGPDALAAFRAAPDRYDLVITDMTMPQISGDRLAAEMVRIRHDVKILMCTGFSEKIDKEKAKKNRDQGFRDEAMF